MDVSGRDKPVPQAEQHSISAFEHWWLDSWPHRLHIRRYVPRFLRSCPEPFRGEVLEVGAGSGWMSQRILETFPQVELTATDVDARAVASFERLQGRYGQRLKVRAADIMHLPFDRNAFDIVIAAHVMHHVTDAPQAVRQFLRVLRPGGLIGITDVNQHYVRGPLRWLWRPSWRLSREQLKAMLDEAGADTVLAEGDIHFRLWARKPHELVRPAENS